MIHKEREDDLIFKNRKSNKICMHDEMAWQYASKFAFLKEIFISFCIYFIFFPHLIALRETKI